MSDSQRHPSTSGIPERLENEISLLQAMYPDQFTYNAKTREAHFSLPSAAAFALRLPDDYLATGSPTILTASVDGGKQDLRDAFKARLVDLPPGEEVLDACIVAFEELSADWEVLRAGGDEARTEVVSARDAGEEGGATVVVWLHHLLNTNKRKRALAPGVGVAGVTKPGYPGVLVYSGARAAVREHVEGLKGLQWAAFQVRLESEEVWRFAHGEGVVEVESMGEVVREVGERRELFMEAMRMK